MKASTRKLWDLQNRHEGDRVNLYRAVFGATAAQRVLYPGSFVDVAASAVFPHVSYVDMDRRAGKFFDDVSGVGEVVASLGGDKSHTFSFIEADYQHLDLADQSFDLLVSLYAGFVSEHCTRFLRVGGWLLVAPSHGDVAMASIDRRYLLDGVVVSRGGSYSVRQEGLDTYLIPRLEVNITADLLHETGRGIAYTKSAFAYLFRRVR